MSSRVKKTTLWWFSNESWRLDIIAHKQGQCLVNDKKGFYQFAYWISKFMKYYSCQMLSMSRNVFIYLLWYKQCNVVSPFPCASIFVVLGKLETAIALLFKLVALKCNPCPCSYFTTSKHINTTTFREQLPNINITWMQHQCQGMRKKKNLKIAV